MLLQQIHELFIQEITSLNLLPNYKPLFPHASSMLLCVRAMQELKKTLVLHSRVDVGGKSIDLNSGMTMIKYILKIYMYDNIIIGLVIKCQENTQNHI